MKYQGLSWVRGYSLLQGTVVCTHPGEHFLESWRLVACALAPNTLHFGKRHSSDVESPGHGCLKGGSVCPVFATSFSFPASVATEHSCLMSSTLMCSFPQSNLIVRFKIWLLRDWGLKKNCMQKNNAEPNILLFLIPVILLSVCLGCSIFWPLTFFLFLFYILQICLRELMLTLRSKLHTACEAHDFCCALIFSTMLYMTHLDTDM